MSHHKSESVRKRSIWESYAVLPPRTRLNISLAFCAVAIAGIFISDRLEEVMPPPPKAVPHRSQEPREHSSP